MDVRLQRGGSWCLASAGDQRDRLYETVDPVLSYPVPGAEWSEKYQLRVWDGRARLHSRPRGANAVKFPSGLIDKVSSLLVAEGHRVKADVAGPALPPAVRWGTWTGPRPYDYQTAAVRAARGCYGAAADPGYPPGCILRLPVRSGKTLIAARMAHEIGLPVLFVVPSDYLLVQGCEAFDRYLGGISIGQFAAGVRRTDADVVVATIQSLTRAQRTRHYQKLCGRRLLIVDEVHHNDKAAEWRKALLGLNPIFTLGLSATFELSEDDEDATSTIWLRGICGPIAYSMTLSELVELGHLVRPTVDWVETGTEKLKRKQRTPQQLYREGIVDCEARNAAIVRKAKEYVDRGMRVIVDLAQVRHTRLLLPMLRVAVGTKWVAGITGKTTTRMRRKIVAAFQRGDTRVLAGTVLGEGADIPEDDVVINGEGGRGYVATMQRLRCLTPHPGKHEAYLVDFVDDHHPKLLTNTARRMDIYCDEPAFRYLVP